MLIRRTKLMLCVCLTLLMANVVFARGEQTKRNSATTPDVYTRIIQLEDERSLGNGELEKLLNHRLPEVRYRAALAVGRIGDKRGTDALLKALEAATTIRFRSIIVFALGEMEDAK